MGHNEDAVAQVRGTKGCCGETIPFRMKPARVKVREDGFKTPRSKRRDVLDDRERRLNLLDDAEHLEPERRTRTGDAGLFARVA